MIYKPKSRRYFVVDFSYGGRRVQVRTRATNAKEARTIEGRIRSELALGNFGIIERKPAPTLAELLRKDFLPYVEIQFRDKQNTAEYYRYGAASLLESELAPLRLDGITDQCATQYVAYWLDRQRKPTTINRDLRTLRRALSLARDWGKLDRMPRISLAKGERQRDRVLTTDESVRYLRACPQPWKDAAALILGTGMRPEEACEVRWERVEFNGDGCKIRIRDSKTPAGRRPLLLFPGLYRMLGIPDAFEMLRARHEAQGRPFEGWVFPTGARSGHLEEDSYKDWHAKALEESGVEPFEPYCLRHTFLTWMAPHVDPFTLARIAGHASIRSTQRYVHPQERTIEQALQQLAANK